MTSDTRRLIGCAFVAAGLVTMMAVPAHAGSTSSTDPLGCAATVHDPAGLLDLDVLEPQLERRAATLDADVRIRVEPSLDGGLDERIDQLRRQCAGWDDGGQLADDLVVVMFSPVERETAIYFGDSSGPAPDVRWDDATDAMIPHLRAGENTEAVEAALREMRAVPTGAAAAGDSQGAGNEGVVLGIVIALVIAGLLAIGWLRGGEEGFFEGSGDDADEQGWSSGSSGSRRRRAFGAGGLARRSSRSRSSSSSSRSSRRAGGGSKKF